MSKRKIGKHDFAGRCKPGAEEHSERFVTFSVGVFEWVPSHRFGLLDPDNPKRSKVKVRVRGSVRFPEAVYHRAQQIAAELDAGTYAGPKTVDA